MQDCQETPSAISIPILSTNSLKNYFHEPSQLFAVFCDQPGLTKDLCLNPIHVEIIEDKEGPSQRIKYLPVFQNGKVGSQDPIPCTMTD